MCNKFLPTATVAEAGDQINLFGTLILLVISMTKGQLHDKIVDPVFVDVCTFAFSQLHDEVTFISIKWQNANGFNVQFALY